jgi:hypothetical protein
MAPAKWKLSIERPADMVAVADYANESEVIAHGLSHLRDEAVPPNHGCRPTLPQNITRYRPTRAGSTAHEFERGCGAAGQEAAFIAAVTDLCKISVPQLLRSIRYVKTGPFTPLEAKK